MTVAPLVYVASSWRNPVHEGVVMVLQQAGLRVHNYRKPGGRRPFSFADLDPHWPDWSVKQLRQALVGEQAQQAFADEQHAIALCDALVLILPCGRGGHLQAGMAYGLNKRVVLFAQNRTQPELMYALCATVAVDFGELLSALGVSNDTGRWEP